MKMNRIGLVLATLVFMSFFSCDSTREHDAYISIENGNWELSNTLSFSFKVSDTIQKKKLFINIRNNNNYSFRNLYLIADLKFPNGKEIVDTLEYEITDHLGKFLGSGFTEIKSSKLIYKNEFVFPVSGDYLLKLSHAMREKGEVTGIKTLKGIIDVGLRVEKF